MAGGAVHVGVPEEDEGEHVEDGHRDEQPEQMKAATRENLMAKRSRVKWTKRETGKRVRTKKRQGGPRNNKRGGESRRLEEAEDEALAQAERKVQVKHEDRAQAEEQEV